MAMCKGHYMCCTYGENHSHVMVIMGVAVLKNDLRHGCPDVTALKCIFNAFISKMNLQLFQVLAVTDV